MWCGNTNEVILVQSEKGTIYRSRDRGESWKKLHSIMHQTGLSVIDEGLTDIGKVKKMMQSPVDDNLVVFTGKYTQVASPSLLLIDLHSQKFSLYEKIKTS